MNDREKEQERRKQRAFERLGTNNPRCVHCGEKDWRTLEPHHLAGKDFDDFKAIECRNCHRKLSDAQKDHPKKSSSSPDPMECIGHFLLGLADFLVLLIEKLREFGADLIARANRSRKSEVRS